MIEELSSLTGFAQSWFNILFSVFIRVGAVVALLPAFGEHMIPMRIRLGITLAFTAIVAPAVVTMVPNHQDISLASGLGSFWVAEIVIGLALGIGLRLHIHALQLAGAIAAQSTSLAQLFGGTATDPQSALSNVFVIGALALAAAMDLHVRVVELFILSYNLMPAGSVPEASDTAEWGLDQIARAFSLGFILAAPFVVASIIYNLALGIINRAMPQLMVAFVGAPAITAGALFLMAVAAPLILFEWHRRFGAFMSNPLGGGG